MELLDSLMYCMAASIPSSHYSNCLALATCSPTVSSIPRVHLAVFYTMFCSSIRCRASWRNKRLNGEYPVVHLTVILAAQSNARRWPIHICLGSSEWIVSFDSVSSMILYPDPSTLLAGAFYRFAVIFSF